MNKTLILLAFVFCNALVLSSYSQSMQPIKYKDLLFSEITTQKNLYYNDNINTDKKKKYYLFDLYQPEGNTSTERPLIIWMHGGGFKFGSKNAQGIQIWCKTFAQRGYVCAAINYRLSKKNPLTNVEEFKKSCSDAVEDVQAAMQFFKENYVRFKIDTNHIILAGNSAGAIIALQAAYDRNIDSASISANQDLNETYLRHQHIAAIINFWGSIFSPDLLKNAATPIVSVCGRNDRIVPIDHTNKSFYGSLAIHEEADSLGIKNSLKIFDGYSHELQKHFNPIFVNEGTKLRWMQAGQFAADFLYTTLFKK